jgi:hypothetical protein
MILKWVYTYIFLFCFWLFLAHAIDGPGLMEIARNGLAFVKMTLEQNFRIGNVVEQAKLTRLIIQLFPDMNPHLNRVQAVESASASPHPPENDDTGLPAYAEFWFSKILAIYQEKIYKSSIGRCPCSVSPSIVFISFPYPIPIYFPIKLDCYTVLFINICNYSKKKPKHLQFQTSITAPITTKTPVVNTIFTTEFPRSAPDTLIV